MNSNYWGRLSVFPDGSVYSNINNPPVGTIKDTIYDLIIKEMKNRSAEINTGRYSRMCKVPAPLFVSAAF